jgi:hypothetical protein
MTVVLNIVRTMNTYNNPNCASHQIGQALRNPDLNYINKFPKRWPILQKLIHNETARSLKTYNFYLKYFLLS